MEHFSHDGSFPVRPCTLSLDAHFAPNQRPDPQGELSAEQANELARFFNELSTYASSVHAWSINEVLYTNRQHEQLLAIYGPTLRRFIAEHTDDSVEGVSLPAGVISFVTWPAQLHVDDEAMALVWAQQHCVAAVDVTITLNGTFDSTLLDFMRRELPFFLEDEQVLSRTLNLSRLQYEWGDMDTEDMPPGCSLIPPRTILWVEKQRRDDKDETGGDDDA